MNYEYYDWEEVAKDKNSPFIRNYIWTFCGIIQAKNWNIPRCALGIYNKSKDVTYITDFDSWNKAVDGLKQHIQNNIHFVSELIDKTNELGKAFVAWTKENFVEKKLKEASNKTLVKLLKDFCEKQSEMYAYGALLPLFDLNDFKYVEGNLNKILKDKFSEEEYSELYELFTFPSFKSFGMKEEIALLKIINKHYNDEFVNNLKTLRFSKIKEKYPDLIIELEEHVKEFAGYYFVYNGPKLEVKDFYEMVFLFVKEDIHPQEKIEKIEKKFETIKERKEEIIKNTELNEFEEMILNLVGKLVWAKPTRKDYQSKAYYEFQELMKEIATRLNISVEEAKCVHPDDLLNYLELKEVDKEKIRLVSEEEYLVLPNDDDVKILTGKEAQEFKKRIKFQKVDNPEKINELTGSVACKGYAKGKVKIINSPQEMSKMNEGDILVATATTPSIITAMKKASAFITDEGGLTCHASIVSRELEIPCIIGTKHATKILKDNMEVELDTDKGIVRIIK